MFLYGSNVSSNGHHTQHTIQAMRRSSQYPYPPAQSQQQGQAADDDEEEYEEEEDEEYDDPTNYQQQQAYQRPHGRLAPSGLSIPPSLPFAPLAKLNSQQAGAGRGSGGPYVYSPQTVPMPPPPAQGYMHPQLRAPSQHPPSPGHPQQQQQQGQFSVLRTDRRTGNLQVAGMSQATHAGAVHSMRQGPPQGGQQGMFAAGGQEELSQDPTSAPSQGVANAILSHPTCAVTSALRTLRLPDQTGPVSPHSIDTDFINSPFPIVKPSESSNVDP
ncbi:hypothetical protein AURDEDRAFT_119008 [Auricularia subglabra TFB-10046 SS5]|nr:hypothetical protein AURDEDRAFT_119008 [Auricularia subglabra TFB-10046 SS5]